MKNNSKTEYKYLGKRIAKIDSLDKEEGNETIENDKLNSYSLVSDGDIQNIFSKEGLVINRIFELNS